MSEAGVLKNLLEEDYDFDRKADNVARAKGLVVVVPKSNQLQFDLDSEEAKAEFVRRIGLFFHDSEKYNLVINSSSSGVPHYHATVTFEEFEFDEWKRICLQSVLGSDPMREYLNAKRTWYDVSNPTRLFEKP